MQFRILLAFLLALCISAIVSAGEPRVEPRVSVPDYLQQISVTTKSGDIQGSGTLVTRKIGDDTVTFVWTAAHVVDNLRTVRKIITADGQIRMLVEFYDPQIVQELYQNGRRVGEMKLECKVIKYSDPDYGEDLAVLMVRRINAYPISICAKFPKDINYIPPIGVDLSHCGSLLGQLGANSYTTGVLSQTGRLRNQKGANVKVFDQVTAVAFPGCVTADTMVATEDGYINILDAAKEEYVLAYDSRISLTDGTWSSNIKPADQVLSYRTITGQATTSDQHGLRPVPRGKVVKVWPTGVKPVLKVQTRNRAIRVTANHPFVRAVSVPAIDGKVYWIAQWCPAGQLQAGDLVATMQKHVTFKKSQNLNLTKTLGSSENHLAWMRLLGFYVGDGYSRVRKAEGGEVCLYTFKPTDTQKYEAIVTQCFGRAPSRVTVKSGQYLRLSSVEAALKLASLGVIGSAHTKRVPRWVFTCPPKLQQEFLEGLIDADGHRCRGYWAIELANKALIEDVFTLAMNLGFGTSTISSRSRVAELDGRVISSQTWSVDIYPKPCRKSAIMRGITTLLPEGLKFEQVAFVQPDGEEMTYDMEVAVYHNFFANGFLVHNSSGGGIYLKDDGVYIGMLTQGVQHLQGFNFIVPIRRIHRWAADSQIVWAIDSNTPMPSMAEIEKIPVEDQGVLPSGLPASDRGSEPPALIRFDSVRN